MSDFSVKVTAQLDTSSLQRKLDNLTGKLNITNVTINSGAIQSAINSAASSARLRVKVDTSYIQQQIRSAVNGAGGITGASQNSGSQNRQTNYTKQFDNLQKEYNKFLATFTKSNGQGMAGFENIKNSLEQINTAMKTLKAQSADGIISNADFGKGIEAQKTQLENLKNQFTQVKTAISQFETGAIDKQIANINSAISKMGGSANTELQSKISGSLSQIQQLKTALGEAIQAGDTQRIAANFAQLQTALARVKNGIAEIKSVQGGNWIDTSRIQDMIRQVQKLEGVDISGIMTKLQSGLEAGAISPGDWSAITGEFRELQDQALNVGSAASNAGSGIKSMFAAFTAGFTAVSVINKVNRAIRDMVDNVHNIDDAMTELKKVTDESNTAYSNYLKDSAGTAKKLGITISDYVNSTADFARLGNSFTDSQELAKVASVYNIVGDDLSGIDQATEHIISSMYAFGVGASDAITIVDKLNEVSNNYAISSGGLGEALSRSASSLAAANNDINQSIALITAANSVTQDPETVGTALRVISMRVRGAKTEIEAAGLETEGMAESTAKLREEIKALSGVDIMLDDNNTFKSTYDIMDELSQKWKDLSDIQQASITELIAGRTLTGIHSNMYKAHI